jgi:excisionase family DNA binding protein
MKQTPQVPIMVTTVFTPKNTSEENRSNSEVNMQKTPEQWTPDYLSVGFIAKRCGVSNATVLRWIGNSQLPAFRLPGGHYRVSRQDLSDFLSRYSMPGMKNQSENRI